MRGVISRLHWNTQFAKMTNSYANYRSVGVSLFTTEVIQKPSTLLAARAVLDWTLQLSLVFITEAQYLLYGNILDGSSKKKPAEHQAAKVALQYLSGILNCRSLNNAGDNWIGFLKESLDVLGLQKPDYDFTVKKVCISQEAGGATPSEDNSQSEFIYIMFKFSVSVQMYKYIVYKYKCNIALASKICVSK